MKFQEVKLYNPGILIGEMPQNVYAELLDSCEKQISNKSANYVLKRNGVIDYTVQGIEEAITLNIPKSYENYLCDFALEYYRYFYDNFTNNRQPKVAHKWLNLQKKYEYRPLHNHTDGSGNHLSFVTYVKIPYDIETEDSYSNHTKKATIFRNGRIEFSYNGFNGKQITKIIDIDKTVEGKTLMFANSFMHLVYPFYTSDEYRISLAGNISL
jgi:hypothetical protein